MTKLLLIIFGLVLSVSMLFGDVEISANNLSEIAKHDGEFVSVKGTVVKGFMPQSGKVMFLNFSQDYKKSFTAVIFAGDIDKFKSASINPETYYNKKTVKIEGTVKIYQGRPEIIVKSPEQIKLVK